MAIPLAQLGRLNASARAPQLFGPRAAIYAYKLVAALKLTAAGEATLRFVKWTGACAHCDKGWFTHWSWDRSERVRCRDCSGTGTRTLHFSETTLPDGQVWHHPWEGRTSPGRTIARDAGFAWRSEDDTWCSGDGTLLEWRAAGEWRPLLAARELNLEESVGALNDVEDWIAGERAAGLRTTWPLEDAQRYLSRRRPRGMTGEAVHGYTLDIGAAPAGCYVCGDTENHDTNLGCFGAGLHWSVGVCKRHRPLGWPKVPPPALITPQIRRWLDRHAQIEEAA